jgi:hypothetical protein
MEIAAPRIRWGALVVAGVSVLALGFVLIAGVIFVYAFSLGWIARGAPDSSDIQRFANTVGPMFGPLAGIFLTVPGAIWLGRRAAPLQLMHGVLLGLIVGGIPLVATRDLSGTSIATLAATVVSGAIGGLISAARATRR